MEVISINFITDNLCVSMCVCLPVNECATVQCIIFTSLECKRNLGNDDKEAEIISGLNTHKRKDLITDIPGNTLQLWTYLNN